MLPMRDGRTNKRTREDSATQPIDAGWLSFAIALLHFPSSQIIRSWNQNHLSLKSEADVAALKEGFIQKKLDSYEEECSKPNCHACRDKL